MLRSARWSCATRGSSLNDMAVLYRSHFHALELQMELTRRNIPFSITSGIRFFEQAHIKDVVAYLKLATNPRDELSFKRMVRHAPGHRRQEARTSSGLLCWRSFGGTSTPAERARGRMSAPVLGSRPASLRRGRSQENASSPGRN